MRTGTVPVYQAVLCPMSKRVSDSLSNKRHAWCGALRHRRAHHSDAKPLQLYFTPQPVQLHNIQSAKNAMVPTHNTTPYPTSAGRWLLGPARTPPQPQARTPLDIVRETRRRISRAGPQHRTTSKSTSRSVPSAKRASIGGSRKSAAGVRRPASFRSLASL